MMLIACTVVICIAICVATTCIIKISKSGNENIVKKNLVSVVMLFASYICSFIALYILLKQYTDFDITKYLGVCSYWLFAGVMLFSVLNLVFFSNKSKMESFNECTAELVKKLTLITLLSILWVISNTLLGKSKCIIFSFPVLMFVSIFIILLKFVLIRRRQLNEKN